MGSHIVKKTCAVFGLSAAFGAALPPLWHWQQGNLTPIAAAADQHTDAIVVFTGSEGRIDHGKALFRRGLAERLMISGLDRNSTENKKFSRRAMIGLRNGIHLDFDAANTIQNARNTAKWVQDTGVTSLRLVTSEDHMPRAYFELRRLLPTSVSVYADSLPRAARRNDVDSEANRLFCRAYETTINVTFCYGARRALRYFGIL